MKFYIKLPWLKRILGVSFRAALKKYEKGEVVGVSNKMDHRYVVFLDYDYDDVHALHAEVLGLQDRFSLGHAYFLRTRRGYHVVFLDLVTYNELVDILEASSCDRDYQFMSQINNNRMWVLRISDKPQNKVKFDHVFWGLQVRSISYPHMQYLISMGCPEHVFERLEMFVEGQKNKLITVRYVA